jgi:hypothetical protein
MREEIYAAVFALVSAVPNLATSSRRAKPLQEITDDLMPALFQIQAGEAYIQGKPGVPPRRILAVDLEIYVSNSSDPYGIPGTILNPILDAIEAALTPDPATGRQTLGNLVYRCWIEGRIEVFEGLLEGKMVAMIPLQIEIP